VVQSSRIFIIGLPKDTQGFLGFSDTIGVDMPLLKAVVATNDKLAEIVYGEIDTSDIAGRAATHAQLREGAAAGRSQGQRTPA
jgi:UDPglucose 6-dehydrogenase